MVVLTGTSVLQKIGEDNVFVTTRSAVAALRG
jgi:hypothetical protein